MPRWERFTTETIDVIRFKGSASENLCSRGAHHVTSFNECRTCSLRICLEGVAAVEVTVEVEVVVD